MKLRRVSALSPFEIVDTLGTLSTELCGFLLVSNLSSFFWDLSYTTDRYKYQNVGPPESAKQCRARASELTFSELVSTVAVFLMLLPRHYSHEGCTARDSSVDEGLGATILPKMRNRARRNKPSKYILSCSRSNER